ncbi:MAG: hypothetical protein IJ196_07095 [Prevotella sp.]|nr:hypothetical protein [Prevotella sp.]
MAFLLLENGMDAADKPCKDSCSFLTFPDLRKQQNLVTKRPLFRRYRPILACDCKLSRQENYPFIRTTLRIHDMTRQTSRTQPLAFLPIELSFLAGDGLLFRQSQAVFDGRITASLWLTYRYSTTYSAPPFSAKNRDDSLQKQVLHRVCPLFS